MSPANLDRDLRSIQEARALARAAKAAQAKLEGFSQQQVDDIVAAMAAAGLRESERLARMAVDETGYGNFPDKVAKNNFALEDVVEAMRGMRTVGVIREDTDARIREIAEPVGVVAAIIPTTNPTSTALFKSLIALKARCGIVMAPHPNAKACIKATSDIMHEAAVAAGAPRGIIGCMSIVSLEGTNELMRGPDTDVILATGGMALVKAAYSAGKPAYGVGPGNVPAYIERTADVEQAARDIIAGTTFDNGTLCSSEQAIIFDRCIRDRVIAAVEAAGGHLLDPEECKRLAATLITERMLVNPKLVGQPAAVIAAAAGLTVPEGTRALVCPQEGVGRDHPLSHEKLSPVLAFYEVEDWREGCARCTELLRFGGLGHTMVIHSQDDAVVLEFGLHKPAHRVLVNTVSAVGAVGLTTGLFPSMTLGCGSWGNNITSDNVGPQHLINVKRLAYGIRPFRAQSNETGRVSVQLRAATDGGAPAVAAAPLAAGDEIDSAVRDFLGRRGIIPANPSGARGDARLRHRDREESGDGPATPSRSLPPELPRGANVRSSVRGATAGATEHRETTGGSSTTNAAEFVAEADVRDAMRRSVKIRIGPRTIITPLANELGEDNGVFERR